MKKLIFIFVFTLALSFGSETSSVPPHPDLLSKIRLGKVAPSYLTNQRSFEQRGIETPSVHPLNKVYKAGTGPFGDFKALVALVEFSDDTARANPAYFDTLMGKINLYYREVSYQNLNIIIQDSSANLGWFSAPHPYSYYVNRQYGMGSPPQNSQGLVDDLVSLIDPYVDFSDYDNDSDGYVDALIVIHTGRGAELTGDSTDMWSHKWSLPYPFVLKDGVKIKDYTVQPEYWVFPNDMTIGVYCHELGHIFGLPDLYDYDKDSYGAGKWSLMAYGNWNGYYGNYPAHPDAWCKSKLGYVTPTVVVSQMTGVTIQNTEHNPEAYKLWTNGTANKEYFLVENRQKKGYDFYLPSSGLLIWHIDENVSDNNHQWYPGHTTYGHYMVALEQADSLWELEKKLDYGDAGDSYPSSSLKRDFNSSSWPNSHSYSGGETYVSVTNIFKFDSIITCDFGVSPTGVENQEEPKSLPDNFSLRQNYPNPFNPATDIPFHISCKSPIRTTLTVYNIRGQRVKTLVNEDKMSGEYSVVWNGKDEEDKEVAGGIYFYRLRVGKFEKTMKMALLR
jgi:immune inhibitor A